MGVGSPDSDSQFVDFCDRKVLLVFLCRRIENLVPDLLDHEVATPYCLCRRVVILVEGENGAMFADELELEIAAPGQGLRRWQEGEHADQVTNGIEATIYQAEVMESLCAVRGRP